MSFRRSGILLPSRRRSWNTYRRVPASQSLTQRGALNIVPRLEELFDLHQLHLHSRVYHFRDHLAVRLFLQIVVVVLRFLCASRPDPLRRMVRPHTNALEVVHAPEPGNSSSQEPRNPIAGLVLTDRAFTAMLRHLLGVVVGWGVAGRVATDAGFMPSRSETQKPEQARVNWP